MSPAFDRRRFLRGAGVAIALPMMESLTPLFAAASEADPERKKPVKRVVCLSNNYGVYQKGFFPETGGSDQLPAHGVQSKGSTDDTRTVRP